MTIYGQPNAWTCGPFALKHALLAHGVFAPADELTRTAGSTEEGGTDEHQLKRAARAHRVDLLVVREQTAQGARRKLEGWFRRGIPVLLCVDEWEHWLTAVAGDGEHLVVFDSKYDAPLRLEPWGPLLARLACRQNYLRGLWRRTVYDLHPVVPRRAPRARLELTTARARELLAEGNTLVTQQWDDLARALLPLSLTPGAQLALGLELERYIAERREAILTLVTRTHGEALRGAAERVLGGLAFAAGAYRATLRPELEAAGPERLAGIVGEWISEAAPDAPRAAAA